MHLLPCSHCDVEIPVAPSQAGDQVICPGCDQPVTVPRLGQLRQFPLAEEEKSSTAAGSRSSESQMPLGLRAAFLIAGLVAVGSLLVAGYCGIRWAMVDVPATSEYHIQDIHDALKETPAANLVREYEDMERYGLEVAQPYPYKLLELERRGWGNRAVVAGVIALIAVLVAVFVAVLGRRKEATG